MRNVWKGLAMGALTGAAVGIGLDWGDCAGRTVKGLAQATGRGVREHGPEAVAAVGEAAARAGQRIKDADLPSRAQETARDLAGRAADSPPARVVREHLTP
jgi:hypothetical protein